MASVLVMCVAVGALLRWGRVFRGSSASGLTFMEVNLCEFGAVSLQIEYRCFDGVQTLCGDAIG